MSDPYAGIGAEDPYAGIGAPAPKVSKKRDAAKGFGSGALRSGLGIVDAAMAATPFGAVSNALNMATGQSPVTGGFRASRLIAPHASKAADYRPETGEGRAAQTAGAMSLNAFAPGNMLARAANVVLPTVGAEGAALMTRMAGGDERAQDVARGVGGLVGSGAASVRARVSLPKPTPRPKAEGIGEVRARLKGETQAAYAAVEQAGHRFSPRDSRALSRDVTGLVQSEGGAGIYPKAAAMSRRVQSVLSQKGGVSLTQLDKLRSQVGEVLGKGSDAEARIGGLIRSKIDDFIDASGAPELRNARAANTRYRKVADIDDAMESAAVQAGSTYSGGNINNATRQKLRPYIDPKSSQRIRNLTPDEQNALRRVVVGTPGQNVLRQVGKLSPEGNGLMQTVHALMLAGGFKTGGVSAGASAAMAVSGAISKRVADRQTAKNVDRLVQLIASGAKEAPQARVQLESLAKRNPDVASIYREIIPILNAGTAMRPAPVGP